MLWVWFAHYFLTLKLKHLLKSIIESRLMIRLLGILSVILFWALSIILAPAILIFGVLVFIFAVGAAVSSLVYDLVTRYLERKIK